MRWKIMIVNLLNHLKTVFGYEEVYKKEEKLSKLGKHSWQTLALIMECEVLPCVRNTLYKDFDENVFLFL